MNNDPIFNTFERLKDETDKYIAEIENINDRLADLGLGPASHENIEGQFKKRVDGLTNDIGTIINLLFHLTRRGYSVSAQISKELDESSERLSLERRQYDQAQVAERNHKWKDWSQRLIRWLLGLIVAILFYSGAVALSEKWDFFKVPGRDIIFEFKE